MNQVLMREDAPLSAEQWQLIDATVQEVAENILVGRRLLQLYGPLGYGAYTVPLYAYGAEAGEAIRASLVKQLPMTTLDQDFIISVRDLELFNGGQPFDTAPVAAAAAASAFAEDRLIFEGDADAGLEGLLTAKGHLALSLSDWAEEGQALADISTAIAALVSAGFYGPYAVVMNPARYANVQRVYGRRGILEAELLEQQARSGILSTPVMPLDKVVVLAAQQQYVDLAVGQDMATAFIETVNMEHCFRIMETLALRIKQPGAICVLA
ncbi:MAG TPA: bacteriocin [Chloroflexi bacterium]|nr:bacteriocin [Chloroflexota bacterium]